jgi:hypothetical protein
VAAAAGKGEMRQGVEGEKGRENAKCIFWMGRANPLSKPRAEVRPHSFCPHPSHEFSRAGFSRFEEKSTA